MGRSCSSRSVLGALFTVARTAALHLAVGLVLTGAGATTVEAACTPSDTTLCLLNGRFAAKLDWNDGSAAGLRPALVAAPKTDGAGSASGLFYFYSQDPDNWEVLVKMIDACGQSPGRFWILVSASTGFQFVLTIRDTQNGSVEVYTKPLNGQAGGVADFEGFPNSCSTPPPSSARVRYLNNLVCNGLDFRSQLTANGFTWVSDSGVLTAYQGVNRSSLGPFTETNDSVCADGNYPGSFSLVAEHDYTLVQDIDEEGRALILFDDGVPLGSGRTKSRRAVERIPLTPGTKAGGDAAECRSAGAGPAAPTR